MADTLIEVRNLTKVYESGFAKKTYTVAVDNVSFDIRRREIVALVGESGSGKSTTAKIILRILPPTSGSVKFDGKDIWRDIKSRKELIEYWRNVQPVFQDPYSAFNPSYKVDRVLHQALRLLGIDPNDDLGKRMIAESLRWVGLEPDEILGKYPHQLSGGQRQRLMIARCFIVRPKLVVADEPVSMIDASLRGDIMRLLASLREAYDTSLLFITHDLNLACTVADRILIMYKGKIVEDGPPTEVIRNPKHEYTKNLINSIPSIYLRWSDIE
uniref:ABC transporter ATP-binding protein n=1 Tax=Ignisphaera aggregans TaxID=334771 RepID=A0A7C2ZLE4_9CREN